MVRRMGMVLAIATVVALAGCGRHEQKAAGGQQAAGAPSNAAPAQDFSPASTPACPPLPDAATFSRSIQAAMMQIYGPDNAGTRYNVKDVKTGADCEHATLLYLANGTTPQPTEAHKVSDGTWYVTLYKKDYPVR